jgi:hypothetical protein
MIANPYAEGQPKLKAPCRGREAKQEKLHSNDVVKLLHQPTYAQNKIHSRATIKLPYVSAPRCDLQGVIQYKVL